MNKRNGRGERTARRKLQLRVSPTVSVLVTFMALTDRSGVTAVTLFAAFLHECGLLCAARLLSLPPRALKLDFLGARLEVAGGMLSYGAEWLLCAAGPLASLLLAAAAAPLWQGLPLAKEFSCASLVLGLLNLLPIRSFDGGRMLEAALSRVLPPRTVAGIMTALSFAGLLLLWLSAAYLLLRAADGLSLLCFSMSLFLRFFDGEAGEYGI